ncbi:hypothetical protein AK830_g4704 [Neonectria ditissima]|uniref:C2H2-type domain-containing protein n=1 Tax=Neonectria ditissima TaxID=78410 RepID=A0A0P7BFN0_9HYPO|nr:hypothetical protein AK830_g4704 [Neonectria ditissima]
MADETNQPIRARSYACLHTLQKVQSLESWQQPFAQRFNTWMIKADVDNNSTGIDDVTKDDPRLRDMILEALSVMETHLDRLAYPRRPALDDVVAVTSPPASPPTLDFDHMKTQTTRSGRSSLCRCDSDLSSKFIKSRTNSSEPQPPKGSASSSTMFRTALWVSAKSQLVEDRVGLLRSQQMADKTLKWLDAMTDFSHKVAIERKYPEITKCFGDPSYPIAVETYPRVIDVVAKIAPKAPTSLRIRVALAMSIQASQEILSKEAFGPKTSTNVSQTTVLATHRPASREACHIPCGVEGQAGGQVTLPPSDQQVDKPAATTDAPRRSIGRRKRKKNCKFRVRPGHQRLLLFCPVDVCAGPSQLYTSTESWLNHMNSCHLPSRKPDNAYVWMCTDASHGSDLRVFQLAVAFQKHMWDEHEGTFDDDELEDLTDLCREEAPSPIAFNTCSLCEYQSSTGTVGRDHRDQSLLNHLYGHFQELGEEYETLLQWAAKSRGEETPNLSSQQERHEKALPEPRPLSPSTHRSSSMFRRPSRRPTMSNFLPLHSILKGSGGTLTPPISAASATEALQTLIRNDKQQRDNCIAAR